MYIYETGIGGLFLDKLEIEQSIDKVRSNYNVFWKS